MNTSKEGAYDRRYRRAIKLKGEASNCIAVAVSTANSVHAAELIEEARKLAQRVRELEAAVESVWR